MAQVCKSKNALDLYFILCLCSFCNNRYDISPIGINHIIFKIMKYKERKKKEKKKEHAWLSKLQAVK